MIETISRSEFVKITVSSAYRITISLWKMLRFVLSMIRFKEVIFDRKFVRVSLPPFSIYQYFLLQLPFTNTCVTNYPQVVSCKACNLSVNKDVVLFCSAKKIIVPCNNQHMLIKKKTVNALEFLKKVQFYIVKK